MNPLEQPQVLYEQIDSLLNEQKHEEAIAIIDKIICDKIEIETDSISVMKIHFASFYIEVAEGLTRENQTKIDADKLILKAFSIFNQLAENAPELKIFIKCNRARGLMVRYDIEYIKSNFQSAKLTFDEIDSIYLIKETLSESIKIYWEALKECPDENEKYNIRNNLANCLSRVGRSIESIILLKENVVQFPDRWQSFVSFAHALMNLMEKALIIETQSLHLLAIESYRNALKSSIPEFVRKDIERTIITHAEKLAQSGITISDEILKKNRDEENDEVKTHTEYRKFVLFSNLGLSEHSLYCFCRKSAIDNLKIGLLGGSRHVGDPKIFPLLDGLVNRLISEFSFARLLYFHYVSGISLTANDIEFSLVSNNDLAGYEIEQLRTSYRIAYGILDKIKNGISMLFEIKEDRASYFEDFFSMNRDKLTTIKNRHLTALYSLSLDLNRDLGSFKNYKKYRNEMEHGFLAINDLVEQENVIRLSKQEVRELTFELLKLTRSAIFSFVFLIRTSTIHSIN